jgi:hypothetical protein
VEKKVKMNPASLLKIGYQEKLWRKRDGNCGKTPGAERSTGYAMPWVCIRRANLPRQENYPVDSPVQIAGRRKGDIPLSRYAIAI